MSDIQTRCKRLVYRAQYRGTKEADCVMSNFVRHYLQHHNPIAEADLAALERLLDASDPHISDWLTGRTPVPAQHNTPIWQALQQFVSSMVGA